MGGSFGACPTLTRVTPDFKIMGVVNVTPDSFFDGGAYETPEPAAAHAAELIAEGADIVDVGGESTRPGAREVAAQTEIERVVPTIAAVRAAHPRAEISVDTMKAEVAAAAIAAGATYVNDVSAFSADPELAELVAETGVECCLMHMQGDPRTMQDAPHYDDVVDEVRAYLEQRVAAAVDSGISEDRIQIDPGIGFGKTLAHNLELLARLDEIVAIGRPVVIGVSRKSFVSRLSEETGGGGIAVEDRLPGSIAANAIALAKGASVFRVHDVAATVQALSVAAAALSGSRNFA